jgi:hypothetical protein
MNDDDECYPVGEPLLNQNDEFYRDSIRLCPFCLLMTWHMHVCHHHHENDQSTQSA